MILLYVDTSVETYLLIEFYLFSSIHTVWCMFEILGFLRLRVNQLYKVKEAQKKVISFQSQFLIAVKS